MRNSARFVTIAIALLPVTAPADSRSDSLNLESAVSIALRDNPELAAANAEWNAEQSAVISRYWPESPTVEFMREKNTNFMTLEMGPMNWWGVSQELMFPLKYVYAGAAQSSAARAAAARARLKAHQVRQQVLTSFFEVTAMTRTLSLLEAQRETLREISRIAESRRATGAVPQQDEMKAHVEQTKIETEILMAKQDLETARLELRALLNRSHSDPLKLDSKDPPAPKLTLKRDQIDELLALSASTITEKRFMAEEASRERGMARLSYLPDFMISYRKPYTNAPQGAYSFSVGFTVPLWFFAKQSSETAVAGARLVRAEKELEMATRETGAQAHSLYSKAKTTQEILEIYETSLIPQATSTMNSSRAAYQAGRAGFVDLLDSERSLYEIRINYYRTLTTHVKNVAALETALGAQASTLPFETR